MILFRSTYQKPSSDRSIVSVTAGGIAALLLTTTAAVSLHAEPTGFAGPARVAQINAPISAVAVSGTLPTVNRDVVENHVSAPVILAQAGPPGGNGGGRAGGGTTGGGTTGGGTTGGGTPGGGTGTPGGNTPGGTPGGGIGPGGQTDVDTEDGKEGSGTPPFGALWTPDFELNNPQTDVLTAALAQIAGECERVGIQYRIDCLGQGLILAGRTLPRRGEYEEARQILVKAGKDLRRVARENRDPAQPKIRHTIQVTSGVTRQRRLTPVAPEKLPEATVTAEAIVQEAETRLLRSAENSQRRRVHYERVAQSLGSTRRILRS
ncbi:MAG: hypothetical protein AAGL24_07870 [Pseudomonadota bacterium]